MRLLRIVFIIVSASVLIPYSAGARQTLQKPLENVFTLELQFGDKDVPSEYLLASPSRFAVNDVGDIYVFDEYKVKVYDKNGKPKTIFGGRGQGPGEFDGLIDNFLLSPTGWLTVSERQSYTLYSPANKFVEKHRYSSDPIFQSLKNDYKVNFEEAGSNNNIFALNDKDFVIIATTATSGNYNEKGEYYNYLFFTESNKVSVIAKYQNTDTYMYKTSGGGGWSRNGMLGSFYFAILPGSKILYTHSYHDLKYITNTAQLTFHIVSLIDDTKREFIIGYTPEAIPDSIIKKYESSYAKSSDAQKEMRKNMVNAIKQRKYYPLSVQSSDGVYLFLRYYGTDDKISLLRVINSESGKEVSSFVQSSTFYISTIKNGYGYRFNTSKDGYPVVEKYRIDSKVYGK